LKIHFNIIIPSTPGSPQWSLFLRFLHQNPVNASPPPPPTELLASPISFFSILSQPKSCLVLFESLLSTCFDSLRGHHQAG
jgi:hypothetical protein